MQIGSSRFIDESGLDRLFHNVVFTTEVAFDETARSSAGQCLVRQEPRFLILPNSKIARAKEFRRDKHTVHKNFGNGRPPVAERASLLVVVAVGRWRIIRPSMQAGTRRRALLLSG